jgi:outer membrane lipoprotein-sorting protein
MSFLRNASTSRLLGLIAVVVATAAGVGVGAISALGGGGSPPPPTPLDTAIHKALSAPRVDGITARITFTNTLVPSDVLPGGVGLGPLISGASGRLWATSDGRLRIELQADAGDTEILLDGQTLTVYDVHANTVYRVQLPAGTMSPDVNGGTHTPPSLASIDSALSHLGDYAAVSGAEPGTVAGQPAYTVRLEPKDSGGLLGAVEVAWDAVHGVPLRVAVYARGDSSPTLEFAATDISYGAVSASDVTITPPATAKVADLGQLGSLTASHGSGSSGTKPVEGVAGVSAALPFGLVAPDALNGLTREHVRLIGSKDRPAALLVYGQGAGAVVVVERAIPTDAQVKNGLLDSLPTVSLGGSKAHELQTSLGTVLAFDRAGVSFVVAASANPAGVEAAALGLA